MCLKFKTSTWNADDWSSFWLKYFARFSHKFYVEIKMQKLGLDERLRLSAFQTKKKYCKTKTNLKKPMMGLRSPRIWFNSIHQTLRTGDTTLPTDIPKNWRENVSNLPAGAAALHQKYIGSCAYRCELEVLTQSFRPPLFFTLGWKVLNLASFFDHPVDFDSLWFSNLVQFDPHNSKK